jgi:hypothetical protein
MILNDRHRFVFVHVPKTAGTSIGAALRSLRGSQKLRFFQTKHVTPAELRAHSERLPWFDRRDFSDYRFVGFVRNPWDRFASIHRYLLMQPARRRKPVPDSLEDFARMLEAAEPWVEALHSVRLQSDFVDGSFFMIGRYEQLAVDFADLCQRLGVSLQLPHKNMSQAAGDYRPLYTDRMVEIIQKRYARDIAQFGYAF